MATNSSKKIDTYSVGFREQMYNELPFARKVAGQYQTNHHEILIEPNDLHQVDDLIWEFGEPFADSSMIPTYCISRAIGKKEKVVLSGDGGDEIFGGYYVYYLARSLDRIKKLKPLFSILKRIPPKGNRLTFLQSLIAYYGDPSHRLLDRKLSFSASSLQDLTDDREIIQAAEREHIKIWSQCGALYDNILTKTLACSLKTRLLNDYLVKVDRASMFASLEVRSPYLDHLLAEEAAGIPGQELIKSGVPKSVLKDIAGKYISPDLLHRRKHGFSIPLAEWFRGPWAKELKETLFSVQHLVPINYNYVSSLLQQHMNGSDHSGKLWALYVFHRWANKLNDK